MTFNDVVRLTLLLTTGPRELVDWVATFICLTGCLSRRKHSFDFKIHIHQVSGKLSESKEIKAGVPQGSVLGPLLFLLYINDLPLFIKHCLLDLFADDGTMHTSNTYLPSVTTLLNADLEIFSEWCDDNDMKKNTSKSKAMFLATRYTANKIMEEPPNITIRGEQIEISETEKLLGVHIDNSLSWSFHI